MNNMNRYSARVILLIFMVAISPAIFADGYCIEGGSWGYGNAIEESNKQKVADYLDKGQDIDGTDCLGKTGLIIAIQNNNREMVEYLVDKNADINARAKRVDQLPLSAAVMMGNLEMVDYLLSRGAVVDAMLTRSNKTGFTALMFAANKGRLDILKTLLSNGADPSLKMRYEKKDGQLHFGQSALDLAAKKNHKHIVRELILAGAKVNMERLQSYKFHYEHMEELIGYINSLRPEEAK